MTYLQQVRDYLDANQIPYETARKKRYEIIQALTGITEEEAKKIEGIHRAIRFLPKDENSESLQQDWKDAHHYNAQGSKLRSEVADWEKVFRRTTQA